MKPTLAVGERVLVDRLLGSPEIGDIVVFKPPRGAEGGNKCGVRRDPDQACARPTEAEGDTNFIKRIVAGPNDRLRIEDGHAIVNGEQLDEPYINDCGQNAGGCTLPEEITIPPGHYFMMGDNRGQSDDSRFWGPVPEDSIIGQAFVTYWPPGRVGIL